MAMAMSMRGFMVYDHDGPSPARDQPMQCRCRCGPSGMCGHFGCIFKTTTKNATGVWCVFYVRVWTLDTGHVTTALLCNPSGEEQNPGCDPHGNVHGQLQMQVHAWFKHIIYKTQQTQPTKKNNNNNRPSSLCLNSRQTNFLLPAMALAMAMRGFTHGYGTQHTP